jgi:hypothetical protein
MKKPSIPTPRTSADPALGAMKEILEGIMGRRAGKVSALPADASLSQVVDKINELLTILQG